MSLTYLQHLLSSIPSRSVQEQTVHVYAISRRPLIGLVKWKNFEFEIKLVDRNRVLPGVVLSRARQESLREKETGNPKYIRFSFVIPVLN